jgi:hypothetical protein
MISKGYGLFRSPFFMPFSGVIQNVIQKRRRLEIKITGRYGRL